jgi:hypothetical protein
MLETALDTGHQTSLQFQGDLYFAATILTVAAATCERAGTQIELIHDLSN